MLKQKHDAIYYSPELGEADELGVADVAFAIL